MEADDRALYVCGVHSGFCRRNCVSRRGWPAAGIWILEAVWAFCAGTVYL